MELGFPFTCTRISGAGHGVIEFGATQNALGKGHLTLENTLKNDAPGILKGHP